MEIKTQDFDETNSNNRFTMKIKTEVFSESEDLDEGEDFDETHSNKGSIMEIKEEDFDETIVALDTYNSDLNLVIDAARFSAKPLSNGGFSFMWAGARATHGASKGKFCFEVKTLQYLNISLLDKLNPHLVRVGFSVDSSTMQLGEDPLSYGYDGTGNISTNCQFQKFGELFKAGDIILAAVDADSEEVRIGFAKNGKFLGWAFQVGEKELKGHSLFPHVLTKNVSFEVNLGQKDQPYFPLPDPLKDFTFIGCLPMPQREGTARPPKKREDCEVIMMCGLPESGKSSWAANYSAINPDKKFNILSVNNIINKMKVMGLPNPRKSHGKWDYLVHKAGNCLRELHGIGSKLKRNYIFDENNVSQISQHRGMQPFVGFRRKAVVVLPSEAEYQTRKLKKHHYRLKLLQEEGRRLPGKNIIGLRLLEMKANFKLPKVNRIFDEVIYTELQKKDAENLIIQYSNHYNKKLRWRCKQRVKKGLCRKLKKYLKENSRGPVVNDIFNKVINAGLQNEDPRKNNVKGKADVELPEHRKLGNAFESCLKGNFKLPELNNFINKVVNKQLQKGAKKISIQENDEGNAAVEPPEKTFMSDSSRFDSGQASSPRGNFDGRNRSEGYRVGYQGDREGYDGSRGEFEEGFDWNRGGFDSSRGFEGGRRGFDMNRGGFVRSRGVLDWNRGGFEGGRRALDWNRGGFIGGLNWNRGGFDRSRGGFDWNIVRFDRSKGALDWNRGGFDRNRGGCDWIREGFEGGQGEFHMNWGGFNRRRGGFKGDQGGFNRKRGREEMQHSGNSYGYRPRNTSRWSTAEAPQETSSSVQTSYSSYAPQIKTEPANNATAYPCSSYTTQVKAEPVDDTAQYWHDSYSSNKFH